MAQTRPQDLTVVRSDVAAETVAAAVHRAAGAMDIAGDPVAGATQRLLRRHALELLGLHDLKADEVLTAPGHAPIYTES